MAKPDVQLTFPILKVEDQEDGSLIVEGTMTSEAVDQAGEVVDYESFKAASTSWVGNIREMHQLTAVGRALGMEFDDEGRRVTLTARVSAGAPDTIAKVKDGTLRYYSIGGRAAARQADKVLKTEDGKPATRVFLRRISETSLVDSGCNPDTGFSIVKIEDEPEEERTMTLEDVQKRLVATEVTDAARALDLLRALVWLYNDETSEQHPEPPEQAKLLLTAIAALKAFAISELGEQAEVSTPMVVEAIPEAVVEMATPQPEVQKVETPEPMPVEAPLTLDLTADVLKTVAEQLEVLKAEISTVREEGAQLRSENAALRSQVETLGASMIVEPGRPVHKAADGSLTTTAPGTPTLPISLDRITQIVQDHNGDPTAIQRSLALEVGVELTKRATVRK